MNLFKLRQYIKYRMKARGRHGLHSPFAYAFVEDVLHNARPEADFISIVSTYYSVKKIFQYANGELVSRNIVSENNLKKSAFTFERLIVFPSTGHLDNYLASVTPDDILLGEGIHNNEESVGAWARLYSDTRVRMSIDVFDYGLLFFREEFKVKQHFVLR